jgi:hypothetical protein
MEQQLETVRKELLSMTAEEYRDSTTARNRLVSGLSQLRDTANRLARQDATELVQRFGELGRRKFHLAAFTNLTTPESVFKIYWELDGRVMQQEAIPIKKPEPVKIPSNDFIAPYEAPPTLEGYSMPGDSAVSDALSATYKSIGDDLREVCNLVKSGKAKFEKNYEGRAVSRTISPDGKRVTGFALDAALKKLSNGATVQYARIPEIPESVIWQSKFICQVDRPGLATYELRTPEFQGKVSFDDSHRLRNFTVYLVKPGQAKEIFWNEKGEIYTPGEQLPEDAK